MYIDNSGRSGYRGTEQVHTRAPFLLLVQRDDRPCNEEIRGIVRKVALRQFGHWMMGTARIRGRSIVCSGTYGADGLTKSVCPEVFEIGVPLPAELREAWNKGGGWNSAGSEGPAMRAWGQKIWKEVFQPRATRRARLQEV